MKKTLKIKGTIGKFAIAAMGLSMLAAPLYAHEEDASVGVHVQAQTGGTSANASATTSGRVQLKQEIQEVKDEMKSVRASTTAAIKDDRAAFMANLKLRREAALQTFQNMRADIKARIEAFKASSTDARARIKVKLETAVKARVEMHLNVILRRFENITDRLSNISTRLATRIETLEGQGKDMSTSIDLLAQADAKLAGAKDDVAKIEAQIKSELSSETSKEELRALIGTAKQSLKDAHSAFVRVIVSIKGESGAEVHGNAGASASTSSSQ